MRHAFRRLVSNPVFSLTVAITLAVAIGANALIFSVVNGVLLKPLPFAEPARLVGVWHVAPGIAPGPMNQAPSTYFTYREDGRVFQDIGLWDDTSVTVTGRGEPQQIEALMVTDGTLPLLTWNDIYNTAPVAIVGENFAREFWGEPAKAVGRRIRRTPRNPWREIVGVVGNERQEGVTQPAPTIIYWPMMTKEDGPAYVQRSLVYAIRTARLDSPGFLVELQQAVWSVNPNLPLARVRTMREIYNESTRKPP